MTRGRKQGRTPEQMERFSRFAEWYYTDKEEREPRTIQEMCAQLGVTNATGTHWIKELDKQAGYTNNEHREFIEKARSIGFGGNSKALELYAKAKGFLNTTKDEEKLELTADEYYNILKAAREKVSEVLRQPGGVGGVPSELPVLPQELRQDTDASEASSDSEMGDMALSDRPGEPVSDDQQSDNSQGETVGDIVAGSGVRTMAGTI